MKKLIKISSILVGFAVIMGFFSHFLSITLNGSSIDILKEYSVDDLKDEKDLPRFKNKAQLMEFINSMFYYSDDIFMQFGRAVDGAVNNEMAMPEAEAPTSASMDDAVRTESKGMSADSDISSTNVQVEGVDEGDIIKTDGKFIYIIRGNEFIIVDAEKEKVASRLDIYENNNYGNINSIYLKGDKAILIGNFYKYYDRKGKEIDDDYDDDFGKPYEGKEAPKIMIEDYPPYYHRGYCNTKSFVSVNIIDISDRKSPKELRNLEFEGYLISGRENDGKIYLVINKDFNYFYGVKPLLTDILPEQYDSAFEMPEIKATDIAKAPGEVRPNIMTIAAIDYQNDKPAETLNILGNGSHIFMSKTNLYIFGESWGPKNGNYTTVVKYNIEDNIKYVANTKVIGTVATQFAFDEFEGNFRIATTSNMYNQEQSSNVFVFDKNLKKLGELTKLAPTERIYSVRFVGDLAYIVTFRQVDPLFVIDMSKNDPVILGELKVPGFSTYLHPVGENLLLGIGKETKDEVYKNWDGSENVSTRTTGLKVSLFDVSDKSNPKELDVLSNLGGEYAYSEAEYNHLAFVYSNKTQTGYFPIVMPNFKKPTSEKGEYYYNYDGAGFVEVVVKNNKLNAEIVVPKNQESKYDYYNYNSQRICYIENEVYFYQNDRLTFFDRATLAQKGIINIG